MCRNHRGFVDASIAVAKLGADIDLPQHRVRRPAAGRGARARPAQGADLRRGVRRPGREGLGRRPGRRLDRRRRDARRRRRPDARVAHRVPRLPGPRPALAPRPDHHPHLGHHRHAQGRPAQRGRRRGRRRAARLDPAQGRAARPTSPRRCSTPGASPTWRCRCCSARRWCCGAASTPSRSSRPSTSERLRGRRGHPGDAPAHAGAAAGDPGPLRPRATLTVVASSGSALPGDLAITWMDQFGDNLYSTYGSHRGRLRRHRRARRTCAPTPATAGRPPYATTVKILDDQGQEVPPGDLRPDLRRQRAALRGLHRRRPQGGRRRAHVLRRRRPVRRRRPPLHRGPRRRDDRLRRRERLPQGGRGLPGPPRGRHRGRRRSASTTTTSASACAPSSWSPPTPTSTRTTSRTGSRPTSPATRCRARSCSSTSCPATPPARSSSATCVDRE